MNHNRPARLNQSELSIPTAEDIFGAGGPPLPPDSMAMDLANRESARLLVGTFFEDPPPKKDNNHTAPNRDALIETTLSRIVPASTILSNNYPEPKFAVKGIIPEGVTFLAGPPKLGKSIMALGIAVAVASGGKALSTYDVDQGDVLYLALEDSERRIQTRLREMIKGNIPDRLSICTEWPRLNAGGLEAIDRWITTHKDARLIIIDTLKMLRPISNGRENIYESDYDVIQPLTKIAAQRVALNIVHHTRKALADDPLATVSGSYGLTGAADGVLVLKRARGKADATLSVIGRDVEEQDIALEFSPKLFQWSALGPAVEVQRSRERQEIIDLLSKSESTYQPKEIAEILAKPQDTVRQRLYKMVVAGEIQKFEGGYQLPDYEPPDPPKSKKSKTVTGVTGSSNGAGNGSGKSKSLNGKDLEKSVTAVTTVTGNHTRRAEV